ncbi:hypothetical protein PQR72_27715 [Paraburkholderia madseniana]|uniref:hypothetical protein n=1 Tax=Paraburkholderia madseniana TaxID=2599607 RepID=UPI0015C572F6|nr:hypothetical protein [Paraburkholderia madseniana]NPT68083.1 hypothetical protein [Paraburkholderia madseniana]
MIHFALNLSPSDPDLIELRTGSADTNLAEKPPLVLRRDQLQITLLCLLRASTTEAA